MFKPQWTKAWRNASAQGEKFPSFVNYLMRRVRDIVEGTSAPKGIPDWAEKMVTARYMNVNGHKPGKAPFTVPLPSPAIVQR
jgi:hypothetical protein